MFEIGDTVIYRRDVCKLISIEKKYKNDEDYYVIAPIDNSTLVIKLPISASSIMRKIMTKKQVDDLIKRIPEINVSDIDSRNHGSDYEKLYSKGNYDDIISIIKTSHQRQQETTDKYKKINEYDKVYFRKAENFLYKEIAASLGITPEEAKKYVVDQVQKNTGSDI